MHARDDLTSFTMFIWSSDSSLYQEKATLGANLCFDSHSVSDAMFSCLCESGSEIRSTNDYCSR